MKGVPEPYQDDINPAKPKDEENVQTHRKQGSSCGTSTRKQGIS